MATAVRRQFAALFPGPVFSHTSNLGRQPLLLCRAGAQKVATVARGPSAPKGSRGERLEQGRFPELLSRPKGPSSHEEMLLASRRLRISTTRVPGPSQSIPSTEGCWEAVSCLDVPPGPPAASAPLASRGSLFPPSGVGAVLELAIPGAALCSPAWGAFQTSRPPDEDGWIQTALYSCAAMPLESDARMQLQLIIRSELLRQT